MDRGTPFSLHLTHDDDWFSQKLKSLLENKIPEVNPSRQVNLRRIDSNIMNTIVANRDIGIAHCQLASEVKINRKNLTAHMKILIEKELVKRTKGKQGRYFPTARSNRAIYRSADLIGNWAAERMLAEADEDLPIIDPLLSTEFFEKRLSDILSKFSNKIGIIITYLLIQSMNHSNIPDSDNIEKDDDRNPEIERWFDNALSSLRPILLPFLWSCVVRQLILVGYPDDKYINAIKAGEGSENIPYLLDDKTISVLNWMLSQQYPKMITKLEKNRSQIPKIIAEQLRHEKYVRYSIRIQQKCNHNYKLPLNKILSEKSGNRIRHCRKCHSTKYHPSLFPK